MIYAVFLEKNFFYFSRIYLNKMRYEDWRTKKSRKKRGDSLEQFA